MPEPVNSAVGVHPKPTRRLLHPGSTILRAALIFVGLAIAFFGAVALHDGDATLGIPGRNTQSAAQLVYVDAGPELLVTAFILGVVSALFILAGISPRLFSRTPVVPLLLAITFVLLVGVPFLTSGE